MCYLEDCEEVVEHVKHMNMDEKQVKIDMSAIANEMSREMKTTSDTINYVDLDIFFRSIGSIFITYITSATLTNLLCSKIIKKAYYKNILSNNSLLSIFSSDIDMIERNIVFQNNYGLLNNIFVDSSIWNLCYFNVINNKYFNNLFSNKYNHKQTMKMIISYICINGMHPFLGINCDSSPNCQWSNAPTCKIREIFEKLMENKDEYNINKYDFNYRNAWEMRETESNLLIDMNEMINFLFLNIENNNEIGEYEIFDMESFESFKNNKFTLFTFKNECDYTYNIQFDIIHCNKNLNIIDNFTISLFGKKIYFGSFQKNKNNKKVFWNTESWQKIKKILLGHEFVNINNWYIISIQSIDTTIHNIEKNNCYYLICAEVNGTYINQNKCENKMYSKLLVWKSCFYKEKQPWTH